VASAVLYPDDIQGTRASRGFESRKLRSTRAAERGKETLHMYQNQRWLKYTALKMMATRASDVTTQRLDGTGAACKNIYNSVG